jgi:recombination protein RecT
MNEQVQTNQMQTALKTPSSVVAKPQTIETMLRDDKYTVALREASKGTGLTAERLLRVMMTAVRTNPKLKECNPISLFGAMVVSASLGLEPNTPLGHAYLIPFNVSVKRGNEWVKEMQVQFIIGYKGYLALARRSGEIQNLHADVVYEGDEFSFEYGSKQHLKHIPKGSREGRKPIWAYAHAKLKDGEAFEVLPYEEILRIRNSSQGYQQAIAYRKDGKEPKTPWIQNEHEMASKTMIRRLAKFIPMSIEIMQASEMDAFGEHGIGDYSKFATNKEEAFMDVESGSFYNKDEATTVEAEYVDEPQKEEEKKTRQRRTRQEEPKQVENNPSVPMPDVQQQPEPVTVSQDAGSKQQFIFGE